MFGKTMNGAQAIAYIIGFPVGALLAAVIVQFATKRIAGFRPSFGRTFLAALIGMVFINFIRFLIGRYEELGGGKFVVIDRVLFVAIGFCAQAELYAIFLEKKDGGGISYGQACLLTVIQLVAVVLITVAVFFPLGLIGVL